MCAPTQDAAAKHISRCKDLNDEQFRVLAGATVEAVLGLRALEESPAAASVGETREAEAGIALLVVEAAKGGISGEDLEVRNAPSFPRRDTDLFFGF